MSEKPTKPADTQQPLFTGPYDETHEYREFKPFIPPEPKEVNGVSVDILNRAYHIVEALDRLSIVSRNAGLDDGSLREPHRSRLLERYKNDDALDEAVQQATYNAANRMTEAENHFWHATGLLALMNAGAVNEAQARAEHEHLWQKFRQTYDGSPNQKRRQATIKQLNKHFKLRDKEVRRTTRKPKPNSDIS